MKINIGKESYEAPDVEVIEMMTEGCVLASSDFTLEDWGEGEKIEGEI